MTTAARLHLALDQGGHASRALVFDEHGNVVAKALCEVAETRPAPERVEQDPEELVRSLRRVIRDVTKQLGRRAEHVAHAGLATQRSSCLAWDAHSGGAFSPVLSWQDRRAAERVAELDEHAQEVRRRTGLRLSPHYGASKLAWCLAALPAARAALTEGRLALGPLSSFLVQRLLDERPLLVDPANASRTLLADVTSGAWDPWLCDLFGIPITCLPRPVATRTAFGTLDIGARKIPLVVVTGDQSAALFARGEPHDDTLYVTFGTGAFVQRPCASAASDVPRLLKSLVLRDETRSLFVLEGTINGAGSALRWVAEREGLLEATPELQGWLEREQDPPLFLNGVSGLAAPYWISDFESRFVGAGTRESRVVAVLESCVFLVRAIVDEMQSALPSAARVRVGGGLSQLDGLCQRLADVLRLPVERERESESTASGLAWLLGARARSKDGDAFTPGEAAGLHARYARFRAELDAAAAR